MFVPFQNAFLAPDKLSMVDAAGTLISYGTAMMALSRTAQLQKGQVHDYFNEDLRKYVSSFSVQSASSKVLVLLFLL